MYQKHVNGQVIAFVGGKTGGHLLPALTLAQQKRREGLSSLFFTHDSSLDRVIMREATWVDQHYTLPQLKRTGLTSYPLLALKMQKAFIYSLIKLKRHKVSEVISTGGSLSIPVCLAAWILRIPVTLYELNAVSGRSIQFLARFARRIYICFSTARSSLAFCSAKVEETLYPLRFTQADRVSKSQARAAIGISDDAKVLFVIGGSQGSEFLNGLAEGYVRHRVLMNGQEDSFVVFHQTGPAQRQEVEEFYKRLGVEARVFSYQPTIQHYYISADLVIARAGAGTLFELAFFDTKAIVIPLESATTNHQIDNAYTMTNLYPNIFNVYRQSEVEHTQEEFYRYSDALLSKD